MAKKKAIELIISKSRTKAASRNFNVSGEFYPALDKVVRSMIKEAESVEELMERILKEARDVCSRLGMLAPLAR